MVDEQGCTSLSDIKAVAGSVAALLQVCKHRANPAAGCSLPPSAEQHCLPHPPACRMRPTVLLGQGLGMSQRPELSHVAPRLVQEMSYQPPHPHGADWRPCPDLDRVTQGTCKHRSALVLHGGCTPRSCSVVGPSQAGLPAAAGGTGVQGVPLTGGREKGPCLAMQECRSG